MPTNSSKTLPSVGVTPIAAQAAANHPATLGMVLGCSMPTNPSNGMSSSRLTPSVRLNAKVSTMLAAAFLGEVVIISAASFRRVRNIFKASPAMSRLTSGLRVVEARGNFECQIPK